MMKGNPSDYRKIPAGYRIKFQQSLILFHSAFPNFLKCYAIEELEFGKVLPDEVAVHFSRLSD